ncbi:MAG: ferritin family protein [candidate division Zixibacteria bacterium]|nr:ferritin family protein [candidate division Zixibacteria bacterium]
MNLEEAIKMALDFENKVRDAYRDAAENAKDDVGKRVFRVLGDEEQRHVDYLEGKLEEWRQNGKVTPDKLDTVVPSEKAIAEGVKKLDHHLSKPDRGSEMEMLSKALQLEVETSNFYQRMVNELGDEGEFFARFLEIEKGHQAIVQAEMDYANKTGYLFDFQDFQMV